MWAFDARERAPASASEHMFDNVTHDVFGIPQFYHQHLVKFIFFDVICLIDQQMALNADLLSSCFDPLKSPHMECPMWAMGTVD